MSSTRDFKSPGIFAEDATTVIPPTPIAGVAYRDAVTGTDDTPNGWRYGTRVASQDFNQVMYLLTSMLGMIDTQGILGWSDQVDYAVPAIVFGSNGLPYIALQASGPSTAPQDPTAGLPYWSEFAMHGMQVITTTQSWSVPVAMQLGYIRPKVTVIGGGGGGGRVTGGAGGGGGGGGGGGKAIDVINLTGVASVAVTIGAGGNGAPLATGSAGGSNGGASFFGTYMGATGGGLGGVVSGGPGGVGSLGSINTTEGPGQCGGLATTTTSYSGSGGGAGGSGASLATRQNGANGVGPGGGGSGGGANADVAASGGNGAAGVVIIEW